jgi:hypothetical protein
MQRARKSEVETVHPALSGWPPSDRRSRLTRSLSSIIFLSMVFLLFGCSSSLELASRWTSHELKVEGDASEWRDVATPISGHDTFVCVKNDSANLYFCLLTSDPTTQLQILALGTTVWFDSEGKKEKSFGIQYPLSGLFRGQRLPARPSPEALQRILEYVRRQMEIIGPAEGEHRRVSDQQGKGVDVRLGYADGTLTYQLKVPLHRTTEHPFAIDADDSKPLTIGIETGNYPEVTEAQTSAPAAGSRGGRGRGGSGSGGRQGSGGMQNDTPDPLKQSLIVHLAGGSGPASTRGTQ